MPEDFTAIGTTSDRFFWALKEFEGKLYAGTYGTPKAYNYPPWTFLKNFAAGESICDLEVFKNRLYAATEKKGYIYRMNTPMDWVRVHEDSYIYALNLAVFGNYLYCLYAKVGGGEKIIRSSDGLNWATVWSSPDWCRHFVVYGGELYLVGSAGGYSRAVKTSNGTSWGSVSKLANVFQGEWFSPMAWNGKLWLSTGGNACKARIYKFDGTSLTEVFRNTGVYEVYMLHVYNNELYALLQPDWKTSGSSYLYKSSTGESGTWTLLRTFSGVPWARCMETFQDELYLGIGKTLYKMGPVVPPTYDCPYCPVTDLDSKAELDAHIASVHPAGEWSANLLINPGAETGDWTGWTKDESGGPIGVFCGGTWVRYKGQCRFGHFGPIAYDNAVGKAWQDVDFSDKASVIDAGLMEVICGGWSGQWHDLPDKTRLVIEYLNSAGALITSYATGWMHIGPYWREYKHQRALPSGCRKIRIRMEWTTAKKGEHSSCFWDEMFVHYRVRESISTEDIICSNCQSTLRITRSAIPENNVDLLCPLCEAGIGPGISLEAIQEGPIFQQLRDEIAALNIAIADLEARIATAIAEIDVIKQEMGL